MGISSILIGASVAASAAGTVIQMQGASDAADAQKAEIAAQRRAEEQRRQAMELDAKRRQLEALRNQQRARALGLSAAANQGAQFGSGLQGGYGQIAGQTDVNLLGVSQNLEIGRNIFAANADLSQARIDAANAGTFSAIGQGISHFGGTLMQSAGPLNSLSKGVNFGGGIGSFGSSSYPSYGSFITGLGRGPIY